jgi:proteasome accessory factor C
MEQLNRVFRLHQLLLDYRRPVPRQQILDRLDCSVSTLKRLLALLRDRYQAPIIYDATAHGYKYDTADGRFTLPGLWLNESEAFALLMTHRLLNEVQPGLQADAFSHLQQTIEHLLGERWQADSQRLCIATIGRQYVAAQHFTLVASALFERWQLCFQYQNVDQHSTKRRVSPQRLCWYRDNWYLLAWCHQRQALRLFALSRMYDPAIDKTAPAIDRSYDQLDHYFHQSYGIFDGTALHQAHLRFSPAVAPWVKNVQWHDSQQQWIDEQGHIQLQFPYADQRELIRDILRFSGDIEVLAPVSLRQAVIEQLQKGLTIYAGGSAGEPPVES